MQPPENPQRLFLSRIAQLRGLTFAECRAIERLACRLPPPFARTCRLELEVKPLYSGRLLLVARLLRRRAWFLWKRALEHGMLFSSEGFVRDLTASELMDAKQQ